MDYARSLIMIVVRDAMYGDLRGVGSSMLSGCRVEVHENVVLRPILNVVDKRVKDVHGNVLENNEQMDKLAGCQERETVSSLVSIQTHSKLKGRNSPLAVIRMLERIDQLN